MSASDLLMVAGEASGDLHAARLLSALRALRPDMRPFGLGGDELAAAGCELLGHSSEIAVVGITEVLKVLPRARELFDRLLAEVDRRGARTAILVDFPDFNLRLARRLADRGVKVVYYVSPQVWAWRRGRLRTMAQKVDLMLVLFPFEVEAYRQHRVPVRHVGHPLVDEVPELPQLWDHALHGPRAAAPVGPDDGSGRPAAYTVALLPGSRQSEVRALLPAMLAAVAEIAKSQPVQARLIQAANVPPALFAELLANRDWLAAGVPLEVVPQAERFAGIAGSHLALCASGTATLEVGLLRTPLIVLYRLTPWSAALARLLVRLSHWSLVNLVLGEGVVPELFQEEVAPRRVAAEAAALLTDAARRNRMRTALAELRPRLGSRGASARAAAAVAAMLPPPGGR
jgi:lipid-A-disaccharide synthase